MLNSFIYFFAAILGLIVSYIIGFRRKYNNNTNLFFTIFIFFSSIRFSAHGLSTLIHLTTTLQLVDSLFSATAGPLVYLYFYNIINHVKLAKNKVILHFIAPCIVVLFFCSDAFLYTELALLNINLTLLSIIVINLLYLYTSYNLLRNKVWTRTSDILVINQQNNTINKWSKLLFTLFTIMLGRFIINLLVNIGGNWYVDQNHFLWIGAILWIGMYSKILISPEFLYGYEVLQNKIKEYKSKSIVFDNIWQLKPAKEITNIQDVALQHKIIVNLDSHILKIENIALNTNLFFSKTFNFADFAHQLSMPKSYLLFIFKYHSSISFNDFKKIIRIQRAIMLIDEGILNERTIESLADQVGFSTYSSFFKSFKSITGHSPTDYLKI